ncbi:hypothetical protein HKD37_13G035964 [Glycine soja]
MTLLPFAHCLLLFSLRCAVLPRILFVSLFREGECTDVRCCDGWRRHTRYTIEEDQWMYEGIMLEEVDTDENEEECGVNELHVDCSDAFNTYQVFDSRDDVLQWARSIAYENRFVTVIVRNCGCPFKLHGKPMVGGQGWMVKLICGIHNHELAKSLVGYPYVGRLTKAFDSV